MRIHVSVLCRLGLYREAEKQFRSALNHQEIVDTYLYLAKVVHNSNKPQLAAMETHSMSQIFAY